MGIISNGNTVIDNGAIDANEVDTTQLATDAVETAKIADAQITLAKLSATGTKNATTFLRGDNTFASSGQNYPAFEAYLSGNQTIGDLVQTKTQFNVEVFDTDGYYDNATNYRFTPLVAGKYYVYTQLYLRGTGDLDRGRTFIRKNGSNYKHGISDPTNSRPLNADSVGASAIIDMNGSTDYLEIFAEIQGDISNIIDGSARQSYFGAFRIGD